MSMERDHIILPREALDAMLEDAAERGARKALTGIGLGDEKAPEHIRGLRDLFNMYRTVRDGALKQIGQGLALVLIGALVFFASTKLPNK
ncbi:hypothetical protein KQ910_13365 [Reyranella sp. MMS21-HV4-11]|jgi:hypothetical protein|uniref:Uncharacterized protein n=1 Tax=Reyranella humidisoli TaxID=2849149 RepID=A0ABS6ING1_9HYPH|nr:DUF6127 family protein [Reyranella sp. MMS21-HV4-11]MBU8874758.1 hypothetical protein [Reyranella sp. MMS21-HV4-11]